jgi:hypothetical protein
MQRILTQRSGLGSPARKLPRCGPDRMGGHQVRLGAVTVPACRGCRIVKNYDNFGLGLARCGPGAILVASSGPYRNPRRLIRDSHP